MTRHGGRRQERHERRADRHHGRRHQADESTLDPRVRRSRAAILDATLAVLGRDGMAGLSIEGIAAEAGVGKATIYRHWPQREDLIVDAFETLKPALEPRPDGTVRERLRDLLVRTCEATADETWGRCIPALIDASERDPAMRERHRRMSATRRQVLLDLLQEGVDGGEFAPDLDVDLAAMTLFGPILLTRTMMHEAFDTDRIDPLLDMVLGHA